MVGASIFSNSRNGVPFVSLRFSVRTTMMMVALTSQLNGAVLHVSDESDHRQRAENAIQQLEAWIQMMQISEFEYSGAGTRAEADSGTLAAEDREDGEFRLNGPANAVYRRQQTSVLSKDGSSAKRHQTEVLRTKSEQITMIYVPDEQSEDLDPDTSYFGILPVSLNTPLDSEYREFPFSIVLGALPSDFVTRSLPEVLRIPEAQVAGDGATTTIRVSFEGCLVSARFNGLEVLRLESVALEKDIELVETGQIFRKHWNIFWDSEAAVPKQIKYEYQTKGGKKAFANNPRAQVVPHGLGNDGMITIKPWIIRGDLELKSFRFGGDVSPSEFALRHEIPEGATVKLADRPNLPHVWRGGKAVPEIGESDLVGAEGANYQGGSRRTVVIFAVSLILMVLLWFIGRRVRQKA